MQYLINIVQESLGRCCEFGPGLPLVELRFEGSKDEIEAHGCVCVCGRGIGIRNTETVHGDCSEVHPRVSLEHSRLDPGELSISRSLSDHHLYLG